jgi:hypothetical protein
VIVRSLAVLIFALGASLLVGALALLGRAPGLPERTRHLRLMKDRAEAPSEVLDYHMADFLSLPHRLSLAERRDLEGHGVRMSGWVQRIVLSGDADLHLELAENQRHLGERDTAYVVAEITPPWRTGARSWSYESLLVAFRPNHGGPAPWEQGPRRVRLTGWLTLDHARDHPVSTWSLMYSSPRSTGWEMHPVTRIELWDEATSNWRELRR